MVRSVFVFSVVVVALGSIGCRQEMPTSFESNLVHSHKYAMTKDLPMDQVVVDTEWALERLFGTPDEPMIPDMGEDGEELATLVSLDNLKMAAGPWDEAAGTGLYRKHCSQCHGITGDGRGPTGSVLVPYPRDYRMGVFKFKSTTRGSKPTREDVAKLIRHGIGGTAMNPIPGITEKQIDALVDYVIYLSWRGEVERKMVDSAMFDLDLEGGERLIRPESAELSIVEIEALSEAEEETLEKLDEKLDAAVQEEIVAQVKRENADTALSEDALAALVEEKSDALTEAELETIRDKLLPRTASAAEVAMWNRRQELERKEAFEENWGYIVEAVVEVADSWFAAEDEVTDIEDMGDIPVPESRAEFIAMSQGEQAEALAASVARGKELFLSESVGCAKCHGVGGQGDGQTTDFDDWTKDWTTNVGLDPKNNEALLPLLARGALLPQNIRPRNFSEGVFRGGSSSEDLYRRIANGIAGTPMPAATVVEGKFELQDIWHLINFIRSLDQTDPSQQQNGQQGSVEPAQATASHDQVVSSEVTS